MSRNKSDTKERVLHRKTVTTVEEIIEAPKPRDARRSARDDDEDDDDDDERE